MGSGSFIPDAWWNPSLDYDSMMFLGPGFRWEDDAFFDYPQSWVRPTGKQGKVADANSSEVGNGVKLEKSKFEAHYFMVCFTGGYSMCQLFYF